MNRLLHPAEGRDGRCRMTAFVSVKEILQL